MHRKFQSFEAGIRTPGRVHENRLVLSPKTLLPFASDVDGEFANLHFLQVSSFGGAGTGSACCSLWLSEPADQTLVP